MKKAISLVLSLLLTGMLVLSAAAESKTVTGLVVNEQAYAGFSYAVNGNFLATIDGEKWGMVDQTGKILVDFQYDYCQICEGGYAIFDYTYLYDNKGVLVYTAADDIILSGYSYGVMVLLTFDYELYYQKLNGDVLLHATNVLFAAPFGSSGYAWYTSFVEEANPEESSQSVQFIGLNGEPIDGYCNGFSYASSGQTIGKDDFILVVDADYWGFSAFQVNGFVYYLDGLSNYWEEIGYLCGTDKDGQYIFSVDGKIILLHYGQNYLTGDYESDYVCALYSLKNGAILADGYTYLSYNEGEKYLLAEMPDGTWGYIDWEGNKIAFFDDAGIFAGGHALIMEDGAVYVIDENLNRISAPVAGDGASTLGDNLYTILRDDSFYTARLVTISVGDMTVDGICDASDLTALARHVGGIKEEEENTAPYLAGDADGDGEVGAADLTKLARFVGGITETL